MVAAPRRWRKTIGAQSAEVQALIDTHREEVARGMLPRRSLTGWRKRSAAGPVPWTRPLEALTVCIEQPNAE